MVVELSAGSRRRDGPSTRYLDAVGGHQLGPFESEVHRRKHATRIEGNGADQVLEVPARDDAVVVAIGAEFLDAVREQTRGKASAKRPREQHN